MFNRSKALAAALLVATFLLGAAVGSVAFAAWGRDNGRRQRPEPRERVSFAERLERDLGLTTAQRESVEVIMQRRDSAMRDVWRQMEPQFNSLRSQINNEILTVLDETQRAAFEQMNARADSARRPPDRRGEHDRN